MQPKEPIYVSKSASKLPLIILALLLLVALIFGGWAFSKMQDYKNNSDKKSAVAVAAASKQLTAQLQAQFAEQNKSPYKAYVGPSTYGSVTFNYPKDWNVYDASSSDEPINAYFYNGIVPAVDSTALYPLRAELVSDDYTSVVQQFSGGNTDVTATAYVPPKMKGVANVQVGTRFDGNIGQSGGGSDLVGSMVVIKVRDKTLKLSTQSQAGVVDFNNIVLASLTFVP